MSWLSRIFRRRSYFTADEMPPFIAEHIATITNVRDDQARAMLVDGLARDEPVNETELQLILMILEGIMRDPSIEVRTAVAKTIYRCVVMHAGLDNVTGQTLEEAKRRGFRLLSVMHRAEVDPELSSQLKEAASSFAPV